jgi:hypothetical protein
MPIALAAGCAMHPATRNETRSDTEQQGDDDGRDANREHLLLALFQALGEDQQALQGLAEEDAAEATEDANQAED